VTFITGKHLDRRTLLRGFGGALALPLLDAMLPALAPARNALPAKRLAVVYVPNGIVMNEWTPAAAGTDFAFKRILKPLMTLFRSASESHDRSDGRRWKNEGHVLPA